MTKQAREIAGMCVRVTVDDDRRRGRGARSNHTGRFERTVAEEFDDGWETLGTLDAFAKEIREDSARTIITRNDSPDISFDRSTRIGAVSMGASTAMRGQTTAIWATRQGWTSRPSST